MSLDLIPFGRITRMQWAILDALMTSDANGFAFPAAFGRVQLPGQVTIGAGTTTLTGIGTDFTGFQNERLVLGDQVARVLSVTSSTALELRQPHADGLVAPTDYYQAPRGYVLDTDPLEANLTTIGWPAFTVSVGEIQPIEAGINRYESRMTILIAMYFDSSTELHLEPTIGVGDLAHQAEAILTTLDGLAVPRFGNACLVDGVLNGAQGTLGVRAISNSTSVRIAGLAMTWRSCNVFSSLPDFRWL